MDDLQLIVGLGNPGPRYARTRHNVGEVIIDALADRIGGRFSTHRSRSDVLSGRLAGARVVLVKPHAFMNESGAAVQSVAAFYKVPVERITVVHDELDLPYGTLRLKRGGGEGGHNGLRSVSQSLGSKQYQRVRFGIGRPPGRQDPADFVLRAFSTVERRELDMLIERAADATEALVTEGLEAAQNGYNE
jgi:PTH1 family peptidyl-tRNA hydrolase